MTIRFGVSPIAWANDDMPELGGDTTVETILGDAEAIGFAGVELGGKFPRDAAMLRPLLARSSPRADRRLVFDPPAGARRGGRDRRAAAAPRAA